MSGPWFIAAERARLEKHVPDEVQLRYYPSDQTYRLVHIQDKKTLRTIPRREVLKWIHKETVVDHFARRALRDAGYPATMRTANMPS